MPAENLTESTETPLKRLLRKQVHLTASILATTSAIIGSMLLLFGLKVTRDEVQHVLVEIGVSLVLFGVTTLVTTILVSNALDKKLELTVRDFTRHGREVLDIVTHTQNAVAETAAAIKPLGGHWRELGLTNAYLTRSQALQSEFGAAIRDELRHASQGCHDCWGWSRETTTPPGADTDQGGGDPRSEGRSGGAGGPQLGRPRLWIMSSTLRGFLEFAGEAFDGAGMLAWAMDLTRNGRLDLRIMLTHPVFAAVRASQENLDARVVQQEVSATLAFMERNEVPNDRVRLIPTTPTVFAVATRNEMLLNPYPYSQAAYRSFCVTVRRNHSEPADHRALNRDIFEQYERSHFIEPWESGLTVVMTEDYEVPPLSNRCPFIGGEANQLCEVQGNASWRSPRRTPDRQAGPDICDLVSLHPGTTAELPHEEEQAEGSGAV
jgi:hypothetical protein